MTLAPTCSQASKACPEPGLGSLHDSRTAHREHAAARISLNRPAGTFSPTGGEGQDRGGMAGEQVRKARRRLSTKSTGVPLELIGAPTKLIRVSTKPIGVPTKLIGTPAKPIRIPSKFIRPPTKLFLTPSKLIRVPSKFIGTLSKLNGAPSKLFLIPTKFSMGRICRFGPALLAPGRTAERILPSSLTSAMRIWHR